MCALDCIRFKMRDTGDLIRKHEHLKEMDKYIKRLKAAVKQEKKDRAFFATL